MKARFGLPKSNTAFSLNSHDGEATEDYNTLVHGKSQGAGNGANSSISTYELGKVSDVKHGIRVDREVDVSVRDKTRQPG